MILFSIFLAHANAKRLNTSKIRKLEALESHIETTDQNDEARWGGPWTAPIVFDQFHVMENGTYYGNTTEEDTCTYEQQR